MPQKVSVVICAYSPERWGALREAVESVRNQDYDGEIQVVVVVDGSEELCDLVDEEYQADSAVAVHCNDENVGASTSRNNAMAHVDDDVEIVAFMDDDAVARPDWIAELAAAYESTDAVAVGGRMVPEWITREPTYLPEEFYWLIGVTQPGFANAGEEVRNTFASNLSFRRDVFEGLGGFADQIGRKDDANLQAEEPEIGSRLLAEYGRGVVYNPDAVVAHKIFGYRTDPRWIVDRAFWQGYSKRAIDALTAETSSTAESDYLRRLVTKSVPHRFKELLTAPSIPKVQQLVALFALTGIVGLGYLYGFLRYG